MPSICAGKALFFSEQELAPNQWVGGANPCNSRQFLPYVLAAKTRGPRLQQLLVNYQDTVLRAMKEVEDGMVEYLNSREQQRILEATEDSARRSLTLADVGYREGLSDFQRVLDAQGALLRAQSQVVAAHGTTARSEIDIYRALGGGWESRPGQGYVDEATRDEMRQRVNWGDLLDPSATEPPLKGQDSEWPLPDW